MVIKFKEGDKMTKKKPSEISEVIYEAQDPIDETRDLDETDNATDKEELFYTDREMYMALAKDFVKDSLYIFISGVCLAETFLATSYLLIGSANLYNQSYDVYIPSKEKAAICDTVKAPLQESMRNSCNQNNLDNGTHEVGYRHK